MNPFEIEKKIKDLTRRVCCAINQIEPLAQACIDEGSIPHTSVTFGDSGGELLLTFSGGSGDNLVTEFRLYRNNVFVTGDSVVAPDTTYVVSGEPPPGSGEGGSDNIILLYRASCEALDEGDGNWTVGYLFTPPPPA